MECKNLIRNVEKCQFKTALPPTNVRFECGHKRVSIYPISRGNVKCDFKAHNQSWWEFSVLRYWIQQFHLFIMRCGSCSCVPYLLFRFFRCLCLNESINKNSPGKQHERLTKVSYNGMLKFCSYELSWSVTFNRDGRWDAVGSLSLSDYFTSTVCCSKRFMCL